MSIVLYNTLTGKKEPFEPADPGHARIYVCGPTVYDYPHIGHARCYVVYDVLARHLRERGLRLTYVRNITDVDDKILKRAAERGEPAMELAGRFTEAFHEDMAKLGVQPPDVEPRVSDHLEQIHALIETLIDKGAAYVSDGDVYFDVQSFPAYGKLSHRKLEDLVAGASGRLSEDEERRKRHPADFVLWKQAKPGEASWSSPWGEGRPGWHIECSAMCMRYLGESFDLHGGGLDLVFPHHENEIAQSESASGKSLAKLWMHNGFVQVNKEKMSKSLGNFFTAREAWKWAEPEALRYLMLTVHYRAPLNLDWTLDDTGHVVGFPALEEAERRVEYVYTTRERLRALPPKRIVETDAPIAPEIAELPERLLKALDDDLNMPVALATAADFLRHVNELVDQALRKKGKASQRAVQAAEAGFSVLDRVLGLGSDEASGFPPPDHPTQSPQGAVERDKPQSSFLERVRDRRARALGMSPEEIQAKLQERAEARASKDFARADALRDELADRGVEVMDSAQGSTWRIP